MSKRVVRMNVLPGQPTNGSGRVCIHLFVRDERGPFVESCALHPELDENGEPIKGRLAIGPARGRLACDSKRTVAIVTRGTVITVTPRTDDPRGVTCPKCIASIDYKEAMKPYEAV